MPRGKRGIGREPLVQVNRRITELHRAATRTPGVICLAGGLPADELLPRAALQAAFDELASDTEALQYGWPEGHARVRRWVAQRLACRGARVDPAHVIVTAGAQQALTLIARALQGARIAVGDATYSGALDAFRAGGAKVGRGGDVRYVIAGVSNPQGIDLADRNALLASGRPLIVDEAYVELRFDGHVVRPLLADAPGRVWHVGTISKTVSPGLRLGWLIPPADQHEAVLELKHAADLQASSVSQAAFAHLLENSSYDCVIERARREYELRAQVLVTALAKHVDHIHISEPEGGLSVWVETPDAGDDIELLAITLAHGVVFDPGSAFQPDPTDHVAMRISFSSAPIRELEEGACRLGRALSYWRRRRISRSA
jgi:2-aminoadipate transaminase